MKCPYCPPDAPEFTPRNSQQTTCGASECQKARHLETKRGVFPLKTCPYCPPGAPAFKARKRQRTCGSARCQADHELKRLRLKREAASEANGMAVCPYCPPHSPKIKLRDIRQITCGSELCQKLHCAARQRTPSGVAVSKAKAKRYRQTKKGKATCRAAAKRNYPKYRDRTREYMKGYRSRDGFASKQQVYEMRRRHKSNQIDAVAAIFFDLQTIARNAK